MSLLIYKILNYEASILVGMTIALTSNLDDLFLKINTMAASVLQLCHKTAYRSVTHTLNVSTSTGYA